MKVREILRAASVGCLLVFAGCGTAPTSNHQVERTVITIQPADVQLSSSYSASIKGKQDIRIIPRVDGYLTDIRIKEGSRVHSGDVMFVIDQVAYQAALESAKANVELCKASVATAQLTYDSRKSLHQKGIVSDFDLATAKNALLTAEAQLKMAQAQELSAKNNLSYTVIKSPSDGVVGKLPYRKGDYVSPSMQEGLTIVANNSQMYVYFSMNERQVLDLLNQHQSIDNAIAQMPEVELQLSNSSMYPHKGRVESISGVIESSTGAVSVRAMFPNSDGVLLSGGSGNVVMPNVRKDVFVIPQQATFEVQDKVYVYRVVDGIAKAAMVEVDKINNGKEYIVLSGLNAGDVIIADGAGLIVEGTPIKVANNQQ